MMGQSNLKLTQSQSATTSSFGESCVHCFAQPVTHLRVKSWQGFQQKRNEAMYTHVSSEIEAIT
jgi:hypothetical protein